VRFYQILYGPPAVHEKSPERVWFHIGDTRLGIEQAASGQKPHIAHFGITVAPFDRAALTPALSALKATVLPSPDESGVVRIRDPFGIVVEVTANAG
jgi:hypothetical protein